MPDHNCDRLDSEKSEHIQKPCRTEYDKESIFGTLFLLKEVRELSNFPDGNTYRSSLEERERGKHKNKLGCVGPIRVHPNKEILLVTTRSVSIAT